MTGTHSASTPPEPGGYLGARLLRWLAWLAVVLVSLLIGAGPTLLSAARAADVLLTIMDQPRPPLLAEMEYPVVRTAETLPLAAGATRAYRYRPEGGGAAPPLVLLHGVHPDGIDEARLRAFARAMAGAGVDVLTPHLPELAQFRITPETLPRMVESVRYHASRNDEPTAGVMGISFAGGLALVAASQERKPWAKFIVTVGSHHDLKRLARYYAGRDIASPSGEKHAGAAHPYGARVIIHAHAERFFPEEDVATARELLAMWLDGDIRDAQAGIPRLSPAAQATMREVLDWQQRAPLGQQILAAVEQEADALAAVSPAGKLADVELPVFVIHGQGDPIIPSSESRWLAHDLPDAWKARVLITGVLRHAEMPNPPDFGDYLDIIDFMAAILRATHQRPPLRL